MIIGTYCNKWSEATHGMPQGVSLNAPYPFHWIKVVKVEGNVLHCTCAGDPIELPIKRERRRGGNNRQYVVLTIPDPIFGPLQFRTYPFKSSSQH